MHRILIVEDDRDIAQLMEAALTQAGSQVELAFDGEVGADLIEQNWYALALLDIMLPKIDGYELFAYLREYGIPAIFITAKGEIADKTRGFHMGADDYLVKPFELEELVLRVENVLRLHGMEGKLRVKDVEVDPRTHTVRKNGDAVSLTPKEYNLLLLLLRNKNVALHRFALYEKVWGEEFDEDTRTLDIHIRRLRKKLGLEQEIKTVYKVGYCLEETS